VMVPRPRFPHSGVHHPWTPAAEPSRPSSQRGPTASKHSWEKKCHPYLAEKPRRPLGGSGSNPRHGKNFRRCCLARKRGHKPCGCFGGARKSREPGAWPPEPELMPGPGGPPLVLLAAAAAPEPAAVRYCPFVPACFPCLAGPETKWKRIVPHRPRMPHRRPGPHPPGMPIAPNLVGRLLAGPKRPPRLCNAGPPVERQNLVF